ncbi:hypothetical protein Lal_00033452 [Lupinus albus]|nr:hypothetical protein Lal_00033452 [Lupinus albus]
MGISCVSRVQDVAFGIQEGEPTTANCPRRNFEEGGLSSAVAGRTASRRDPFFSHILQATRLALFQGRKLAYVRYAYFPHELEVQGSNTFIELHGKLYPSLIREFYSNFIYKGGHYLTMVNGKMSVLDEDLFLVVGGLSSSSAPLGDCENEQRENFDAVKVYKFRLRDSVSVIPGGLSKPTTHDLKLIFAIREGILVNWPA